MIALKLFKTKIELHPSFFLLVGLIAFTGGSIFAAASVLFSFLHELVHGRTAKCFGYTPEKISMGLFGGVLHLRDEFIKPRYELMIHLSGPLFNLAAATSLYVVLYIIKLQMPPTIETAIVAVMFSNLVLGVFNLMPFYPLDGGKIVKLYLAFFLGYGRAEKISRAFSLLFSFSLFFFGLYLMQYNLLNCIISALAVNLYIARKQDYSFIFFKVSRDIEQGRIAPDRSKIVVCRESLCAMKAAESYKPRQRRLFTIVNERGAYRGQLTEEEVLSGIYDCGIYADFSRLLARKKKRNGDHYI